MLQQLINILYRHPKARIKLYKRFGGYSRYRRMLAGQQQMKAAACRLSPVPSNIDGYPIYFLTGKKYLYQTLFCIQSLTKVTKTTFRFVLIDDGTFDDELIGQIEKKLPGCTVVTAEQIQLNLERTLPRLQYPNLHRKRHEYPHIKKLTDIHTIHGDDWKLVLDSDMLFWKEPDAMLNWLIDPKLPLHMVDCEESFGYSRQLMQSLTGNTIPNLLNVGTIGLRSSEIPWQTIEEWVGGLEQQEGKTYYLEQALTAMIIGSEPATVLNAVQYVVNPSAMDDAEAVLHHYVDVSKKLYFTGAWKRLMQ